MSKSTKIFWQGVLLPLGLVAVVAFGALILPRAVHALTIESVGGTLGLGNADLKETIINVIKWALGLLGLVAVIVIMYGGFLWLTSRGNEQQIDKAKRTLINGVIGLVIILLAWAIVLFVQRFITNATNSASAAGCTNIGEVQGCVSCLDPDGNGEGEWLQNGTCIPPTDTNSWNAINEVPGLDATNVSLCSAAVETFGGLNGAENNASAGDYTVNELDSNGNVVGTVAGTTARPLNRTAEFSHPVDFKPNTRYSVTRNGFLSSSTPALPLTLPPDWSFTTGTEGDDDPPTVSTAAPTGTINCLKPNIGVVFSEPMLPSSVHVDNITISPTPNTGAKLVDIAMNAALTGFTARFDQPLAPSTTYTVRLNAETSTARVPSSTGGEYIQGFKDMCVKNALDGLGDGNATVDTPADDYVWTFTTAATTTVECTPKITNIESTAYYGNISNDPQQALTITGENFNVTGTGVLFPGLSALATEVSGPTSSCFSPGFRPKQVGAVACIPANGWQDRQITTLVPAGITPSVSATGPVTGGAIDGGVIVQNVESSPASNRVDIQTPHIDWVSPRDGRVGTFVTIGGTHFGAAPGRVIFRKTDGTEITGTIPACAGTNGWTEDQTSSDGRSQIIVQVPSGFSVNELADIQIEHSTLVGATGRSNLHRFTVNDVTRPGLCNIVPQCHNSGGQTLTAAGEGLGTDLNAIESFYISSTAAFSGTPANLNSGAGTVESRAPNLGNNNYLFQLSVGGQATNPLSYKIPCLPAPAVVTNSSCNLSSNPQVTPSPNPTPNATNVCRNIRLSVRYNQSMLATSLEDPANVSVRRCDRGADFTCTSPQALTVSAASATYVVANDTAVFTPSASLEGNYWYEVTVRGSMQSASGVNVGQDFSWHFKTKDGGEDCPVEAVSVQPGWQGPRVRGQLSTLTATPRTNTCALLSTATTFTWQTSDVNLAPLLTPRNSAYTADVQDTVVPVGTYSGTATVTATSDGKSGRGDVQVVRDYCETDDDCNVQCGGSTCNVTARRCNPVVQSLDQNAGPAGGMVSINGCFFGSSKGDGTVRFISAANSANTYDGSFAICGPATWTDTNILVQAQPSAPNTPPNGSVWDVQVQTSSANGGLTHTPYRGYTIANVCQSTTGGTVNIPPSGVPIVCSVTPTSGREGATVRYSGENYVPGSSTAFFTRADAAFDNLDLPGAGGTAVASETAATTTVPGGAGATLNNVSRTSVGTPSDGDFCLATPRPFSVSCEANAECSTGCCASGICSALSACTDNVVADVEPNPGTLQCRNVAFVVTFTQDMQTASLNSANVQVQRTDGTVVTTALAIGRREVRLTPQTLLTPGASYQLFVRGGTAGVVTASNRYMSGDWTSLPYSVSNTAAICTIARTAIVPATDIFTCSGDTCSGDSVGTLSGNQHAYIVDARDASNTPLPLRSWTWAQGDSGATPSASNIYGQSAAGGICPGNATSATYCSQSLNVASGQERLSVDVTGTGWCSHDASACSTDADCGAGNQCNSSGTGTASATVQSFLCANPWPAAPNAWPFTDPAVGSESSHNFTMAYCGDTFDGASLRLPVTGGLTTGLNNLRKEYFLFVQKDGQNTGDAIGVRIHSNPGDLSPERWYRSVFNRAPSGSTLEVDGYPAIREGRTVYVSATNCASAACTSVYPNMYIFSYSNNAKDETIKIFEQLLQNIHFNTNAPFTADQQAMLRRDTKRVHAYNEIIYALETYAGSHGQDYPKIDTGSYVNGLTTSAWPSWQQTLGQALGITMPRDVLPLWDEALCPDADTEQATCWNQTARRFTFPSNTTDPPESRAIMYRYQSPTNVLVYGTLEQNLRRNSTMGDAQADSPNLAATNSCPNPSVCNGFNIRIGQNHFASINDGREYIASSPDQRNPVVTHVGPLGATLQGVVDVEATATDAGAGESGVAFVTFSVVDASARTVASETIRAVSSDGNYHWSWNTRLLQNVGHTLTITATDRSGRTGSTTRAYTIANPPGDNVPPALSGFTPPDQDATLAGIQWNGSAVTLGATATEPSAPNNSGVAKVEFYLGSSKLGQAPATTCTSTSCPTTYTGSATIPATLIQQFPDAGYTYSVVAYDVAGNTVVAQVPVTIRRPSESVPPTVQITAPTTGISGTFTEVAATATDVSSGIDRLEFFIDSETTPRLRDYNQPFSYSWPHTGYTDGSSHTVRVDAYDRAGNLASVSRSYVFTVVAGPDTTRPALSNLTVTRQNGTTVALAGASLTDAVVLNATLTDNVAILRAELFIDAVRIPLTGGSYYPNTAPTSYSIRYPWNTLPELVGSHTVAIAVYDTANNVTTYSASVTVDNQVIMSISQPQVGTTVRDGSGSNFCEHSPSTTCTVNADCPSYGECLGGVFPGRACTTNTECGPRSICELSTDRCITGVAAVPVTINVTRTCRTDQLLSSVQFYLDNSTTPLSGPVTCTNGRCTYNWSTLSTTSNGTHVLKAIGTDSLGCRGGSQVSVIVNNTVNDVVAPTITSFLFGADAWNTGAPEYINNAGLISVEAVDNIGGGGLAQIALTITDSNGSNVGGTTCSTSPCTYTWNPADGGNYNVRVTARDAAGNTSPAQTQIVNVDRTSPTGSWLSPASGSTSNTPPDLTFSVNASDPQTNGYASGISMVVFYRAGGSGPLAPLIYTGTNGVFSWVGQPPVGTAQYYAEIFDLSANRFVTAPVTLTIAGPDTTAPTSVAITTPSADNWWFNGTTTIVASAQDNPGGSGIASVQFFLNGATLGAADTTSPYTVAWDTTTAVNGQTYSITARACDRAPTPNCLMSAPRLMRVWNEVGVNPCRTNLCSGATSFCCNGTTCQSPAQACGGTGT